MSEPNNHRLYILFMRLLDCQLLNEEKEALRQLFFTHPEILRQYAYFIYFQEAIHGQLTSALQGNDLSDAPETQRELLDMIRQETLACGGPSGKNLLFTGPVESTSRSSLTPQEQERVREVEKRANRQLEAFLEEQRQQRLAWEHIQRDSRRESIDLHAAMERWVRRMSIVIRWTRRAVVAIAALVLCVLTVWGTFQYIYSHRIVAVLDKTSNVQWAISPKVSELCPGPRRLEQGIAQITFKDGAQVLLQAPCEFCLKSSNSMQMFTGSLITHVPPRAHGFVVETPNGRIIDFGTEFGVAVNDITQTEIHIFQGKVGFKSSKKVPRLTQSILEQGDAMQINSEGNIRRDQVINRPHLFIRAFPPNDAWGIPGVRIDLADIVGGGNGFGTGLRYDPTTGQGSLNPMTGRLDDTWRPGNQEYTPAYYHLAPSPQFIPSLNIPYIDGVFIPDAGKAVCIISSEGNVFTECPDTDGMIKWNVNNGWQYATQEIGSLNTRELIDSPGISMHANCGLTFALDPMRHALPGIEISRFTARAGMPVNSIPKLGEIDLWILVDGHVRFHEYNIRTGQMFDIQIPLHVEDRFLSLVVTDSQTEEAEYWSQNDWCHFIRPTLILTQKDRM
ncbi:MAG: FecR domain-containing protein [Sedimentisphaerales bacterium]|nr:FecR domain-containing protein [Sedimentisphaerales bacterium]